MNELRPNSIAKSDTAQTARADIRPPVQSDLVNTNSQPEVSGNGLPLEGQVQSVQDEQVQQAISKINEFVQQTSRTLDFQLDETSGQTIIRVYDTESEKLIRQIPSELALELAQKLNDEEPSLLFSAQV